MVSTVSCDIKAVDSAIARRAAEWALAFHPAVAIRLHDGCVDLSSAEHSDDQLRAIWLSSLANERLHARAVTWRAATLSALIQ